MRALVVDGSLTPNAQTNRQPPKCLPKRFDVVACFCYGVAFSLSFVCVRCLDVCGCVRARSFRQVEEKEKQVEQLRADKAQLRSSRQERKRALQKFPDLGWADEAIDCNAKLQRACRSFLLLFCRRCADVSAAQTGSRRSPSRS
jgi:hypothetical protein